MTKRRKWEPDDSHWRPVTITKNRTVVAGGYAAALRHTSGLALVTDTYEYLGRMIEFVPLILNAHWFLKVVGGDGAIKGHFADGDMNIGDHIRSKMVAHTERPPSQDTSSAVAGDDDDDPMSQLKATPGPSTGKAKAKPKAKFVAARVQRIQVVRMPETCADGAGERDITVMLTSKNQLRIAVDDVPWLCEYVAGLYRGDDIPEPHDPDEEPTDSREGFRCEWSPAGSWKATVETGPLAGEPSRPISRT